MKFIRCGYILDYTATLSVNIMVAGFSSAFLYETSLCVYLVYVVVRTKVYMKEKGNIRYKKLNKF